MISKNVTNGKRRFDGYLEQRKRVKKIEVKAMTKSSERASDTKTENGDTAKQKRKKLKKPKRQDTEDRKVFNENSVETVHHTKRSAEELNIGEEDPDSREEICVKDPFIHHFNMNLTEDKSPELENLSNWKLKFISWPHMGRMEIKLPVVDKTIPNWVKGRLDDERDRPSPLPTIGVMPFPHTKAFDAISEGFVEQQLIKNINPKSFSAFQGEIFTLLSNYIDFWHTEASPDKWDKIRLVYSIHCLNHILKSRKQIMKNNKQAKLVKEDECPPRLEDQGFTRPRVLVLLPFKHSAYRVIKTMISLLGMEVMHRKKFEADFGPKGDDEIKDKPEDFYKTFAGDISENFKIGISVTKSNLKLYSSFRKCDIIIASPLAMRFMLEVAKSNSEKNVLSSIEVLVMDQADIFLMQNWEHIPIIRDEMSRCPKDFRGMDFDLCRIHRWHYNNLAQYYKQTIVFSSTSSDYIRGFVGKARNFAGKVRLANPQGGVLPDIKMRADLTMLRIPLNDPSLNDYESRFAYFTKELLPMLRKNEKTHILIYIPEYHDYLLLANYFKNDGGTSVATINEYMIKENAKVAKARSLFFEGRRPFLLYTERFHFYRRYKIKGVRRIVFYAPPTYPHFFKEICELLSEEYQNVKEKFNGLSTIYLPYRTEDAAKIIDLIGSSKTEQIVKSGKNYHSYLTGIDL